MKKIILFLAIFTVTACTTIKQPQTIHADAPNLTANQNVSDRENILNVIRNEIKKRNNVDAELTVNYLEIQNNWAYIETIGGGDPSINAVLKKQNGVWMLAAPTLPCSPICPNSMPTCADAELVCQNTLHQQFPAVPVSIFPTPDARRMTLTP